MCRIMWCTAVSQRCYNQEYCYWQMDQDGSNNVNFLDYIGTHMLGLDLDLLRQAFGLDKISIVGLSCACPASPES